MTEREQIRVDPNTADVETLGQLPGVGGAMAGRIVQERPFASVEDMTRVRGISPAVLERMRAFLAPSFAEAPSGMPESEVQAMEEADEVDTSPISETEVVEAKALEQSSTDKVSAAPGGEGAGGEESGATGESLPAAPEAPSLLQSESETDAAAEPPAIAWEAEGHGEAPEPSPLPRDEVAPSPESAPAPSPAPQRPGLTRAYVGWMVGVGGLLTLILALALSLGVLAALNGGQLQFVRPAEFGELQVQVEGLETRAGVLDQDVASLRTRLNNLEALSARVGDLEQVAEQLQSDLGAAESSVESLTEQVSDLRSGMTNLTGQLDEVRSEITDLTEQLDEVSGDVETLQAQFERSQAFFDGLRDLVNGLFQPEGGTE